MNNRSKLTAFVIATAFLASVIPTGTYAAEKELKSTKGTIYNAVAYKDGKFYIAGEPKNKDENVYYFSNGNYNKLKDIDADDTIEIYGSQYVKVEDGDYYVDLETGKVKEEKIEEKEIDKVAVNLRSNIKSDNDGRYNKSDANEIKDLKAIPNAKFNNDWYEASYKIKEVSESENGGAEKITVYTNEDGKYIDADYNIGKIKVKLSNGKTANIKNTSEEDENVRGSVHEIRTIGQDSNNIYRLAKIGLKVSGTDATIKSVNGLEVDKDATILQVSNDGSTVTFDVIQVISKSQSSSKVDGIKYAKNVSNYMISDKNGKKIELLNNSEDGFTVADGKLINYKINDSSIEAEIIELESKSSLYYIERGNSDSVKISGGEECVEIDTKGNLWVLTDGYIRKFDNDEDFEKIYTIDEEYDNLSVYDKDNIIVWCENDNTYSLIGGADYDDIKVDIIDSGSGSTNGAENTDNGNNKENNNNSNNGSINSSVKQGWVSDSSTRTWKYVDADGSIHKGWLSLNGSKYYMDPSTGVMQTDWKKIDGTWYYMQVSGEMKTGWLQHGGNWYYLQSSGAMSIGWVNDNGTWYYCDDSGKMLSNTTIGGYKLGSNGAWIK